MKPSTSNFVSLRGRQVHYRTWGAPGAPLLFMLHGWADVAASFQFVVDELRRDWFIVAPDWRGFGKSQANNDTYWILDYLADLDALLEHFSPGAPANLVAHSMGANVASLYAGVRPERVAGLVNLEGFGLMGRESTEAPDEYAKWLDQMRQGPWTKVYPDTAALAMRLQRDNPRLTTERAAFLAAHFHHEVEGGIEVAMDGYHRLINPVLYRLDEAKACWRRIAAPVLFVRGSDSKYMFYNTTGEADFQERLACIARYRVVALTECGHNLHHDRPEDIARLIEEFFPL